MPADGAARRFLTAFRADFGAEFRALDQHPGRRISHQRRQHRVVELVAAADRAIGAEQRRARERKIADRIKRLVAGKLIGEAQAVRIEQTILVDDEGVVERGTERIARAPKLRHVSHEAEGAGARKFPAEGIRLDVEGHALTPNQRVSEVDLEFNTEAGWMRPQLAVAVAAGDA